MIAFGCRTQEDDADQLCDHAGVEEMLDALQRKCDALAADRREYIKDYIAYLGELAVATVALGNTGVSFREVEQAAFAAVKEPPHNIR